MESKSRRPVTSDHPAIKAATTVLRDIGGPAKAARIFERAHEGGLLPTTALNTTRARMSQHLQHSERDDEAPALVRLPLRRGWMRPAKRIKRVKLTAEWLRDAHAPAPLIELVEELEGSATLGRALCERLDINSLHWLIETLPFEPELAEELRDARGARGRREVLREIA